MQSRSTTTEATLARYRKALPPNESAALGAWLSTFYPFQRDWVLDPARLGISNKARQIGFSHSGGAVGTLWGAFHGELTTIISIGDRESVEVLDKARKHAFVLTQLGSRMARVVGKDNANELAFASGGRIIALPSSGGRSFTGNVFLDEYAYQQNSKQVWDAAAAVTMLGFKLRISSTPNGVGNDFHQVWVKANKPGSRWSPHQTTIDEAIAQGFPVDIASCWELAKGDPRIFDQLFRCSFLDNEFQYIPSALLTEATTDEAPPESGACFAGLDVGRTADLTALVILRQGHDGTLWVIVVETKKRTSNEDLDELVAMAIHTFGARRVCIDATGMGSFPAEALQKKYGRHRVEPVNFSLETKEGLATGLYQRFAERGLRLGPGEKALREDVCAIRRIVTTAGNVRYDAPTTSEGHADRAWALALAVHAAGTTASKRHEVNDYDETDDA